MKIQISGYRGEGKSTIARLLYKTLVAAGYVVYNRIPGMKYPEVPGQKHRDIIIEELFGASKTLTNKKEN